MAASPIDLEGPFYRREHCEMRRMMLVYFLIGLLWPGLLFYWLLIIAPLDGRGLPRTP
jgi:hypothetical protein